MWDSFAIAGDSSTGRFESEPVRCTAFYRLRFEIAGAPDAPGMRLALRDAAGRETVVPAGLDDGGGWRSVHVRCPDGPLTLRGGRQLANRVRSASGRRRIAWASALAESIIARWAAFDAVAALLTLLSVGFAVRSRVRRPAPPLEVPELTHG